MSERRRPRHLIDPATLGRPRPNAVAQQRSLERVQRWVMLTLAVTTILHLVGGLLLAAWVIHDDRSGASYGLTAIAAFLGMASVAAGLAIHRHTLATPWLLLGIVPAGVVLTLLAL